MERSLGTRRLSDRVASSDGTRLDYPPQAHGALPEESCGDSSGGGSGSPPTRGTRTGSPTSSWWEWVIVAGFYSLAWWAGPAFFALICVGGFVQFMLDLEKKLNDQNESIERIESSITKVEQTVERFRLENRMGNFSDLRLGGV